MGRRRATKDSSLMPIGKEEKIHHKKGLASVFDHSKRGVAPGRILRNKLAKLIRSQAGDCSGVFLNQSGRLSALTEIPNPAGFEADDLPLAPVIAHIDAGIAKAARDVALGIGSGHRGQ